MNKLTLKTMAASTLTLVSLVMLVAACTKSTNDSTPNDVVTDVGATGIMYFYRLDGSMLSRAKCVDGQSTLSLCQEGVESVDYDLFKVAFARDNQDISEESRTRILAYLESAIAYRARSTDDLMRDDRTGLARLESTFNTVRGTPLPGANVTVRFSPNGGVADAILANLDKARTTVDIAMYSFSDRRIQDRVEALARSGVKIRLILESPRKLVPLADRFEAAGIDIRYVVPIMHHKFAVIDYKADGTGAPVLLTGSANWSSKSDTSYDDDFFVIKDLPATISAFQSEFDHIWAHSYDYAGPAGTISRDPVLSLGNSLSLFTSANFEVFQRGQDWSFRSMVEPEAGVAGKAIIAAIDSATTSIKVATTHYRRQDIHEALIRAIRDRGVIVEMITDQQEYSSGSIPANVTDDTHFDEMLARDGGSVVYKTYMVKWSAPQAKQMHTKYIIVDDTTVLSGSFNWSKNSETGSMENLSTWTEATVVQSYLKNFKTIRAYNGDGGLDTLLQQIQQAGGIGPCNFTPIALAGRDIDRVRRAYNSGACR